MAELLKGTLDLLILRTLSLGPNHGLGIARRIGQVTRGELDVKPGSLFPALYRLEEKGWVATEWGSSDNNRQAKYYSLTRAGRKQLAEEEENWRRLSTAITQVLETS